MATEKEKQRIHAQFLADLAYKKAHPNVGDRRIWKQARKNKHVVAESQRGLSRAQVQEEIAGYLRGR